jgi:hypothetical protein
MKDLTITHIFLGYFRIEFKDSGSL